MLKKIMAGACAALLAASSHAADTQVSIDASRMGWYTASGVHESYNNNTLTGVFFEEYRSFFEWTLPSVTGHVTGAHLEMALPYSLGSDQGTQTGAMFDVAAANLPFLSADNGAGHGTSIFADLGTGTAYGNFVIRESDDLTIFSIDLNAAAVRAIDAANGGTFALGMRNTTPKITDNYFLFSSMSQAGEQTLVLDVTPVPEASPFATLALGVAALAVVARRRKGRKSA